MPVVYPTPNIRRLFGYSEDAVGGTTYENLTPAGSVPDAASFWPATGGTLDRGLTRIERTTEVRGTRRVMAPLPFRAAPAMTVPFPAYRSITEKLAKKFLGGTDVVTGSATTGYTHTFSEMGFGTVQLPAMNLQMVRDDLNHKMSGGVVNRLTIHFPIDAEGTVEAEWMGLYHSNFATTPPTGTYTDVDNVLLLRDAQVWIDGSATSIPDLNGFELTLTNNVDRHWYANHNVVLQTLGASPLMRKLWFPSQLRLGAQMDITGTLTFANVNTAQDLIVDFAQIQQFVFNCVGGPVAGSSPTVYESIQITVPATELHPDSQTAPALAARGALNYAVNFGGYLSPYQTYDLQFQSLNSIATALT